MKKVSKKILAGAVALTMVGSIPTFALNSEFMENVVSVSEEVSAFANVKDGVYKNVVYTFTGGSGKTKLTCENITVKDGKATATIVIGSGKYPKVTVNGVEYMKENTDETQETSSIFTFPIDSFSTVVTGTTTAMSTTKNIDYTLEISKLGQKEYEKIDLQDGVYTTTVTSNAKMFKIEGCVITVSGESITADITMSGTGYDKLYVGKAADAEADLENGITENIIDYKTDENGKYVFTMPLFAFDEAIEVAAHAVKSGSWFDRELTFSKTDLKPASEETIKMGDVNGDGQVNLQDVLAVLKAALGIEELEDKYKLAADVDGEVGVTLGDVLIILKISLGIMEI